MRFPGFSLHQFFVRLHFYCFSQFLEFLLAVNLVNALFFCLSVCLLWVLGWKKFKLHAVHLSCSPPCRHLLHVHDCWTVYAEALSEETPGHQRERLHRLRLPRRCHLLFCAGSGKCTHTIQNLSYALWSKNTDFLIIIVLCFFFLSGIWERQHSLLDCFLCDPHSGHAAAQHTALLYGSMEAQ